MKALFDKLNKHGRLQVALASRTLRKVWKRILPRSESAQVTHIPVQNILLGAEGDTLFGSQYAKMTGDWFRTSTRCLDGPHVRLLQEYAQMGEKCLVEPHFKETEYYKNALTVIHYLGGYYPYITKPAEIRLAALRFVLQYENKDVSHLPSDGHNGPGDTILVRPILGTDLYQLISGNHRVAFAVMSGQKTVSARVCLDQGTKTYFQQLFEDVIWDEGKELYQPLELPEFARLSVIRKCSDRFNLMKRALQQHGLDKKSTTFLDIGSYFGWFVSAFDKEGYRAYGLERDFRACELAEKYFSLPSERFIRKPLEVFVQGSEHKAYDIVSFLSVLHHFAMGKSYLSAESVFSALSAMTGRAMFFETGEEHEAMFGGALSGWNADYIEKFIKRNSDFRQVIPLGRDSDAVGKYKDSYSRMLFLLLK